MGSNYWKAMKKQKSAENKLLRYYPNLTRASGIYMIYRTDEHGIRYAYIGQAVDILERLGQHLVRFDQRIDKSLKSRGLFNRSNPNGWLISFVECSANELDDQERKTIIDYAVQGFQMYNKTLGGQGTGKIGFGEQDSAKGYRDGLKQGRINAIREVREFFTKYLVAIPDKQKGCYKKDGSVKEIYKKKFREFQELLNQEDN